MNKVPNAVLDSISFEIIPDDVTPKILSPLNGNDISITCFVISAGSFASRYWLGLSRAVGNQWGRSVNDSGFRYPTDELDPGEEPFEGVEMYVVENVIYVDLEAFERVMLRFFKAAIESAVTKNDPVLQEEWWPEFLQNVARVEERCARAIDGERPASLEQ